VKVDPIEEKKDSFVPPTMSEIPDLFFDEILVKNKLTRTDIIILIHLYRQVWCQPNLYKDHGISPLSSHQELAKNLELSLQDVYQSLRRLEENGHINTVRSGQYFVRKYFTKHLDEKYHQSYDDFEV